MLSVAVLGPVEIRRDGTPIEVPSGRSTEVLVRLALDAGQVVRAERIIDDLWGESAGTGRNTLQSKVSQLRRALGDAGAITSGHGGYTLVLDREHVDALHVADLAASVGELRRVGDAATALAVATQALGVFRGEVLSDAGDGEWVRAHRVRLDEIRLGLIEDQFALRIQEGAGGDLIGELEVLVSDHPLREGLWGCLITALYRAGRQADALAAYERVRRSLAEDLGLEPGPELRSLEHQILQQDPGLVDDGPRRAGPAASLRVGNLPGLSSEIVGRQAEVVDLGGLLDSHRLVTVVGPGGVGKTRTSIEVARHRDEPGGVWLVRLDGADPSAPLPRVVAETLQLSGGEPTLVEHLSQAPTLLLLDNCEHVVDEIAALVVRLLDAAPQLRILATSQLPLGVDGETVYTLGSLPLMDSITLFAGRAREIRAEFVLDDDSAALVEEVCRSLDGLPLAIELAAARARSLSVQEIARRLDDRFALLSDPTSRQPERRRALSAAIGWSYDLLFPDDQSGLWALACFAAGAPLAAAEHVLGALGVPSGAAIDVIDRLVQRSLVLVDVAPDGDVRYRLLDSIRLFGLERLEESDVALAAHAAHAEWFAGVADRCGLDARGPGQPRCVAFVRAERANIDVALTWTAVHDPALGLRIANGFSWTWVVLGDGVAGAARGRAALAAAGPGADGVDVLTSLLASGWLESSAGDVVRAESDLARALELAEQMDDSLHVADVQRFLAFLRVMQARWQDALDMATSATDTYRSSGRDWDTGATLLLVSFASMASGDLPRAAEAAHAAVAMLQPLEDSWALVHAEAVLGAIAGADRRFDDAAVHLRRAAEESERLGFVGQAAYHLTALGRVEQQAGDPAGAIDTLERAIAAASRSGDLRMRAMARLNLARVLRAEDRRDEAAALLRENHEWYSMSGGGDGALMTRALLAAMDDSDAVASVAELHAVLEESRRIDDLETQVVTLDSLAARAVDRSDVVAARQLLAEADGLMDRVGHLVDDADRLDAARARTLLS